MAQDEVYLVEGHEVVVTSSLDVSCDGGNGPLGHPRIYMTLERGGEVTCKYCGRRYVSAGHPDANLIRTSGERVVA
jgi:uncharacterized Zn-finger protein